MDILIFPACINYVHLTSIVRKMLLFNFARKCEIFVARFQILFKGGGWGQWSNFQFFSYRNIGAWRAQFFLRNEKKRFFHNFMAPQNCWVYRKRRGGIAGTQCLNFSNFAPGAKTNFRHPMCR